VVLTVGVWPVPQPIGRGWSVADLRAMIAPLVTFLPGAALTMAVLELSAGEMITGASRLVSGILQLLLLGFGSSGPPRWSGSPRRRLWSMLRRTCSAGGRRGRRAAGRDR
jgi:hypothetical protein